jgi:hypothetical protein
MSLRQEQVEHVTEVKVAVTYGNTSCSVTL